MPDDPEKGRIFQTIDAVSKLALIGTTVFAAYIANQFQAKMSGTSLLNQREQAESQLRASMFGSLIEPIAGPQAKGMDDVKQEQLLVELLTLNFHEHVEFKPLLVHADERLRKEITDRNELEKRISSLRSVARRVRDRQLAVIERECGQPKVANGTLTAEELRAINCQPISVGFDANEIDQKGVVIKPIKSPEHQLDIAIETADWGSWSFEVDVVVSELKGEKLGVVTRKFELTPYDLPFTDNFAIDRDHRFSVFIDNVMQKGGAVPENMVILKVVWFPKNYIFPHERPINHQEIRRILKLESKDEKRWFQGGGSSVAQKCN